MKPFVEQFESDVRHDQIQSEKDLLTKLLSLKDNLLSASDTQFQGKDAIIVQV